MLEPGLSLHLAHYPCATVHPIFPLTTILVGDICSFIMSKSLHFPLSFLFKLYFCWDSPIGFNHAKGIEPDKHNHIYICIYIYICNQHSDLISYLN